MEKTVHLFICLKRTNDLEEETRKKQSFADVPQTMCSQKFRKFHRKPLVLESLFNKVKRERDSNTGVFL